MKPEVKNTAETTDCVFGSVNRQRIINVEKWLGVLQTLVFWLFAASFTTLGSAVVALVMALIKKT